VTGDPRLSPSPQPATPAHLRAAQERYRLLRTELQRVREAAVAWRNGLGALLAGLVGFGLIKGRSDIGQITPSWAAAVGLLLLSALIVGAVGALLLLRAAHGALPSATRNPPPVLAGDHLEALASAVALRRGVAATILCALLLAVAVGATWYGPVRDGSVMRVTTPSGPVCGSVERLVSGILVLRTATGEISVDMRTALGLQAVDAC
jgi:hypothetical protein